MSNPWRDFMTANRTAAEQKLLKLKQQFEHWRQTRKKTSERIPVSLWDQAIELTPVLANSYVAKQLRLSPGDLKKRRLARHASAIVAMPAAATGFIELPAPASWSWPPSGPVDIEVERPDGVRMRLSYQQAPSLATVLQAFLDHP
jgi:hypothetical protein